MHVDKFIERYTLCHEFGSDREREAERYARWVLTLLRLPAALRLDFQELIPKLFCDHKGKRYRVVHASHLGYVGLNEELAGDSIPDRVHELGSGAVSEFRLTVYADKNPVEEDRCGHNCKFLVWSWISKTARCVAFGKALPVATGEAYRLNDCLRSEERTRGP